MPSSSSSSSSGSVAIISKCTVYPAKNSITKSLKLSVSDLPMLSCQYIQKGVLLSQPPMPFNHLISLLKLSLSKTLSHFSAIAGRLSTDPQGHVHILCNDSGVEFIHATATHHFTDQILLPNCDVHPCFKTFFAFDKTLSYAGHHQPIAAVQVTELGDGVFIGCTVNHAVVDGTSFWNFFNTFAEISKGAKKVTNSPDFSRENVFISPVVLPLPAGGPSATFSGDEPVRERIIHFTREAILKMKFRANNQIWNPQNSDSNESEIYGKASNDVNGKLNGALKPKSEISSFQSLSAQLWRAVTRARKFPETKTTTFRMAVNCRHRIDPKVDPHYFGNLIQSIPTVASVADLLSHDLSWAANQLHQNVVAHDNAIVRRGVKDWESNPKLFPLGNFDGAMITMGSSPRFPMYNNDFGWGRPLAVRSGKANKFDGKISAFPGRDGDGSIDLEVVLAPETMAALEHDQEFMQYVS
ncbi:BAHD acyltransferase DCR [Cynara cardunculus var. scolymus]|uniref:Chloramphenicol acetyltransferase-like domain-containing protein n=1 Tax=Cynara cardunculus var. scolymus TaxID=59895 RepID=A0A118K1V0_CYNCS|nr:BAHD acyltransferase DCR [Cynara cardunculus var. scolymus]KVI03331.1 Chloramphenicol acetyltransferase-like domain-containing protein [Cynara cardunculus var. scolymus]